MLARLLLLCLAALPLMAGAEIYKWKDKDGVTRYSDVPPPSNIKQEPINGKKVAKPTGQAPLAPVAGDITTAISKNKTQDKAKEGAAAQDDAAKKRAQDAEVEKAADKQKQAELKVKQENCMTAKKNLATYTIGGRISRINDAGEREYLSDEDVARGKADSQKDVDAYCN
ncbi:DUF4124 domain-containing protein [Methylotenera mobilis]|uniref:DUF4124 domain-containing protein n=1 Tax=Methylotenera mobilis (strain JLW8 / ATCC BAA-1282 / DSM 17540) TaxID=583345 RepID=C6WVC0_METML|nr:DUF4124 domain-containing protein [Methylotenera mobilis]ACT47869.1 conserved hypothetical protein [Methylotenera mobilis JLW8]